MAIGSLCCVNNECVWLCEAPSVCNFTSLGLSRAEFVHSGSASNPVFSPSIAEQVGMRIGVPVQLSSSVPVLSVLSACIYIFSYRNNE